MNNLIEFEKDVYIDGELAFYKDKTYEVHYNGTSSLRNEFAISDITGRGSFLIHISCNYKYIK